MNSGNNQFNKIAYCSNCHWQTPITDPEATTITCGGCKQPVILRRNKLETFQSKLDSFLEAAQKKITDHYAREYPNLDTPQLTIGGGTKFKRIVKNGSAFAFVATVDGRNKTLGSWKAGDIFKPASWKAPAKHARGNIFDEHNGMKYVSEYGPSYLR